MQFPHEYEYANTSVFIFMHEYEYGEIGVFTLIFDWVHAGVEHDLTFSHTACSSA